MTYTARVKKDEVEVTKALEVATSGAGRIGYRVSSARATPVSITVVDRIAALEDVQVPVTDCSCWTLTGSSLEFQLPIEPDQRETTVVRFQTDDPRAVADAQHPPQLHVDGSTDLASNAASPGGETTPVASEDSGGFEFPHAAGGDGRVDDRPQRQHDRAVPDPTVAPPRNGGQSAPSRAAAEATDAPTYPIRIDREGEFSMPDDEYTEADLIATGPNSGADE